jgi:hypothetical protein
MSRADFLVIEPEVPTGASSMRIVAIGMACLFATSAFAKYYVVQDMKTKKCTVVDEMPLGNASVTVVGPAFVKTRKAAEEGIKHIVLCTMK